ncbi:hypothetical protein ACLB1S_00735 [Escherichia coli]
MTTQLEQAWSWRSVSRRWGLMSRRRCSTRSFTRFNALLAGR